MTTYTTQPYQWPGYTTILEDGRWVVSVPDAKVEAEIERLKQHSYDFWSKIAARTDDRLVIARGTAYSIGSPDDNPRGFGGSVWLIRFFDGREVRCNSLWCLGDIPADWRDRLPDNATLKEIGYEPR
jgi:hypothetical protein